MADALDKLSPILNQTIAPQAADVDAQARFPRAALDALGQAGLLGLVSSVDVGGMGGGLPEAARVIERIAEECPSTAMVLTMHYCAAGLIEKYGPLDVRRAIAAGQHVSTLAWSETGSRSHFWAPQGTAKLQGDVVVLDASKSMVTSAVEADSYVWSSLAYLPEAEAGAASLWLVDSGTPGLASPHPFNGLGLRGNASAPVQARGAQVPVARLLGADGAAGSIMQQDTLPLFVTLSASACIGLMEGVLRRTVQHVTASRFAESGTTLAELPTIRAYLARARIRADQARALRDDALAAMASERPDTVLRVHEIKASAAEAALEVTDTAMRICGGAAYRKELGIERLFRDARAASIMAPTSDVLFDLIGQMLCDANKNPTQQPT